MPPGVGEVFEQEMFRGSSSITDLWELKRKGTYGRTEERFFENQQFFSCLGQKAKLRTFSCDQILKAFVWLRKKNFSNC